MHMQLFVLSYRDQWCISPFHSFLLSLIEKVYVLLHFFADAPVVLGTECKLKLLTLFSCFQTADAQLQ